MGSDGQLPLVLTEQDAVAYVEVVKMASKQAKDTMKGRVSFGSTEVNYDVYHGYGGGSRWGGINQGIRPHNLRSNWARLPLKQKFRLGRDVCDDNWFLSAVSTLRNMVTLHGFRFSEGVRDWAMAQGYQFRGVAKDVGRDFLDLENVVALWQVNDGSTDALPWVSVVDLDRCEYKASGGVERLKVTFASDSGLQPEDEAIMGTAMYEAIRNGKEFEIRKGDPYYDFQVMTSGKRGAGFSEPSLLTILDDLEFIEMIKVGDYNGASWRRKITRQTRKGYAVNQGPLAGQPIHNLTPHMRDDFLNMLKKQQGGLELITNFDIDQAFVLFETDFFSDKPTFAALRRIREWSSFSRMYLNEAMSQGSGVSDDLRKRLRDEVMATRADLTDFLSSIFNSKTFLGPDLRPPEPLIPRWDNSGLYSTEELVSLVNMMTTQGMAAPQFIREDILGLDNGEQVRLMKAAHKDREGYVPAWEARQGLLSAMFEDLEPPKTLGSDGGTGGRPNKEEAK